MTPDLTDIDGRSARALLTLDPRCQAAFADFLRAAKVVAREHGCTYVMIAGNRTWTEQAALYAKGRTAPGKKVTNARAGYSNHNFGIAADFGVFKSGGYMDEENPALASRVHRACAANAEACGLDWGGHWESFPDAPHYEAHTVLSLEQKRERYKQRGTVL